MALTEAVIEGTLKTDGTLELDKKPDLPAGRVTVVLRPVSEHPASDVPSPGDDPFWQRMQGIWAIPISAANASDGGANSLSEVRQAREEWDEHQEALEALQGQNRTAPQSPEEPEA